MKKTINVNEAVEYLSKVNNRGKDFLFRSISENMFPDLITESLMNSFRRLCNVAYAFERLSIKFSKNENGIVEITKPVKLTIKGNKEDGQSKTKNVTVTTKLAEITNPVLMSDDLIFYLNMDSNSQNLECLESKIPADKFAGFESYEVEIAEDILTENYLLDNMPSRVFVNEENLLSDYIATLKKMGLVTALPGDIICMNHIYTKACEHFPVFDALPKYKQMKLIHKGYEKGVAASSSTRDVHLLAKATFEVLADANVCRELLLNGQEYKLKKQYRHHRFIDGRCFGFNEIKLMHYSYNLLSGYPMERSFQPFDLWHLLAKDKKSNSSTENEVA